LLQSKANPYFTGEKDVFKRPIDCAWSRLIPRNNEKDYRRMTSNYYEQMIFQKVRDLLCEPGKLIMENPHGHENKTSWEYLYEAVCYLLSDCRAEEVPALDNSWKHFDDLLMLILYPLFIELIVIRILRRRGVTLPDEEFPYTSSEDSLEC
jgi:hypothetical protein